mmetsp:Transcript_104645/g.223671  ORF Transcript_104645/g.223671 Transcript_104645/m.223671 type:complete len:360 (+) Transcript_104645:223-1302(+)
MKATWPGLRRSWARTSARERATASLKRTSAARMASAWAKGARASPSLAARRRPGRSLQSQRSEVILSATSADTAVSMACCKGRSSRSWSNTEAAPKRAARTPGKPKPAPSSTTTRPSNPCPVLSCGSLPRPRRAFGGGEMVSHRAKTTAEGHTESPLAQASKFESVASDSVRIISINCAAAPGTWATWISHVSFKGTSNHFFAVPPAPTPSKASKSPGPAKFSFNSFLMSAGNLPPSLNMASTPFSQSSASRSEMPNFSRVPGARTLTGSTSCGSSSPLSAQSSSISPSTLRSGSRSGSVSESMSKSRSAASAVVAAAAAMGPSRRPRRKPSERPPKRNLICRACCAIREAWLALATSL